MPQIVPSSGSEPVSAQDALARVRSCEAWAVVRRKAAATAGVIGGSRRVLESLMDIPVQDGPPEEGRSADRLVAVPFRQVRERGFEAVDDGTPLVCLEVECEYEVPVDELLEALPDLPVEFSDPGGFATSDAEYADVVQTIIADEIGNGEGANLVIGRPYTAQLAQWGPDHALTVLRRLLVAERGAYWTFVFFTGDRYLVGASPERHVSVRDADVRMNPISGTFRLGGLAQDERKERLLEFLADEKEIYELFMVVDEELKMMCRVCSEGGQVLGPYLKPMTHLVHTEYLLAGRTHNDLREVLRETMFAATVTGAPVGNACRLIARYEPQGRGYYGAALALFGRKPDGTPTMDSPIVIRTADVSPDGALRVTAGATLVRDSDPLSEVAETRAKAGGILGAFGLRSGSGAPPEDVSDLMADEDVRIALGSRNQRLARFWLTDQAGAVPSPVLQDRSVAIVEGDDDFVNMLEHVFTVLGMQASVVRHSDWTPESFDAHDLVVLGPGPGDPRDSDSAKIASYRAAVDLLLQGSTPFLAVCLGHQVLCDALGISLAYKDIVFQGTQSDINLFGRPERVGFYNTFVGRQRADNPTPQGVRVASDPVTGDIHAVAGAHFRGIQFHAESILTEDGFRILRDLLLELLG